jgi:hypothetical protein
MPMKGLVDHRTPPCGQCFGALADQFRSFADHRSPGSGIGARPPSARLRPQAAAFPCAGIVEISSRSRSTFPLAARPPPSPAGGSCREASRCGGEQRQVWAGVGRWFAQQRHGPRDDGVATRFVQNRTGPQHGGALDQSKRVAMGRFIEDTPRPARGSLSRSPR